MKIKTKQTIRFDEKLLKEILTDVVKNKLKINAENIRLDIKSGTRTEGYGMNEHDAPYFDGIDVIFEKEEHV